MGIRNISRIIGKNCPITGFPYIEEVNSWDGIEYILVDNIGNPIYNSRTGKICALRLEMFDWQESIMCDNHKHEFAGMVMNGDWDIPFGTVISEQLLKEMLDSSSIPKKVKDKYENLLFEIDQKITTPGEPGTFKDEIDKWGDLWPNKFYCRSYRELQFIFKFLVEKKYIEGNITQPTPNSYGSKFVITVEGYAYLEEIQKSGNTSSNCFIAMSFSDNPQIHQIRQAIKSVLTELDYRPILIDETHPDSDQTINDAMIAELKKAKFCIADFTEQKDGVYFESGFAAGLGIKVIYTCHKKDFTNTHFDTNHFPHIRYENMDELRRKLKDKIEAWIT